MARRPSARFWVLLLLFIGLWLTTTNDLRRELLLKLDAVSSSAGGGEEHQQDSSSDAAAATAEKGPKLVRTKDALTRVGHFGAEFMDKWRPLPYEISEETREKLWNGLGSDDLDEVECTVSGKTVIGLRFAAHGKRDQAFEKHVSDDMYQV
jgi:hypothetical protein